MSKSTRTSNPLKGTIGASLVIILTSVAASVGVGLLSGVSIGNVAPATAHEITGTATPARVLIADTLTSLSRLGGAGPVSWASDKPYPYNCGTPSVGSAVSASSPVTVGDVNATVAVSTYSAGLGAATYPQLTDSISACTGPLDIVTSTPAAFGVESAQVSVNRAGTVKATVIARTGDIIWFVSSPNAAVTARIAQSVAGTIATLASRVCADKNSVADAATRNLVLGEKYKPFSRTTTATIPDPGLPVVAKPSEAIPLDTPITGINPIMPETTPAWPVWPKMPDLVQMPTITEPATAPVLSSTYTEQLFDSAGPGCGWAFTGASAPSVNSKEIKAKNDATRGALEDNLTVSASDWSNAVLTFWKAWPAYQQAITDYTDYQTAVKTTNTAWDAINAQWATYNSDLASYNLHLTAYNAKITQIATAKSDYAAALAACNAPAPEPSPTATPDPNPTPSPSSSTAPATAPADCNTTVPKPAVLSESDPVAPVAPTAPADPRPVADQIAARAAAAKSGG